ncbi:DNA processing protein [Cryobacterium flavum]|uniref:DNA processing protein n=1 Tax=Cryobacterium flavum TaxID=1424659 RepID=A0A4R8UXP5_9MICO|nr:DNA-processing protein DprA [Cryobacterium flavum]TFB73594.1 DNA-protecting protein DprA [Cryobacterium flavum]SDO33808.1 DNA processing protein [Cryobacterium flavum]
MNALTITQHLTTATAALASQDLSPDAIARAVWTTIGEPGDTQAGGLIAAVGAADALTLLCQGDDTAAGMDLTNLRERVLPRVADSAIVTALAAAAKVGAVLITPEHPHWPAGFANLGSSAPHALWARGNTALLVAQKSIAVVGARAATGYGEHVCMDIVGGLVGLGHTIVSGAAYGIDGMAHRAALASDGQTVAYLAGGVDRFYPTGHDALLTRIVTDGVVASEMGCGAAPTKWRFLMRNRLIAAGSTATLVVEAGWRSGSLNVAGHASSLGRPLGAVPGAVTSPSSAGCHRLIKEFGARIITDVTDAAAL